MLYFILYSNSFFLHFRIDSFPFFCDFILLFSSHLSHLCSFQCSIQKYSLFFFFKLLNKRFSGIDMLIYENIYVNIYIWNTYVQIKYIIRNKHLYLFDNMNCPLYLTKRRTLGCYAIDFKLYSLFVIFFSFQHIDLEKEYKKKNWRKQTNRKLNAVCFIVFFFFIVEGNNNGMRKT